MKKLSQNSVPVLAVYVDLYRKISNIWRILVGN